MKMTILLLIPAFIIVCSSAKPDNNSRKHLELKVKTEVRRTVYKYDLSSRSAAQPQRVYEQVTDATYTEVKTALSCDGTKNQDHDSAASKCPMDPAKIK